MRQERCRDCDQMAVLRRLVIIASLVAIAPVAAQEIEADTRQAIAPDVRAFVLVQQNYWKRNKWRVNMRLDFAWSDDSDAIHFSVGEAF